MNTLPESDEQLSEAVRERYSRTALEVLNTGQTTAESCCSSSCCSTGNCELVSSDLYSSAELSELPTSATLASLGCGNPTALAELKPGEKVLALGRGGTTGFAYGLDMTDAMLELAERNRVEVNVENVRFLKGVIENIPLPDNAVDVVISNCVINLSADKGQVLREAYRVLSPGGRFAVSDIVFLGHFPSAIRNDLEAWAGCIAGALEEEVYRQLLTEVGFTNVEIEVTRRDSIQDVADIGGSSSIASLTDSEYAEIDGKFVSAFIHAQKPFSIDWIGGSLVNKNYPSETEGIARIEDSIQPQILACIFLDFLEISRYTSNNLKTANNCSTLWKRYVILMFLRHWIQAQEMLKRRKRRLLHPIDGPGAVYSQILSSSSHF